MTGGRILRGLCWLSCLATVGYPIAVLLFKWAGDLWDIERIRSGDHWIESDLVGMLFWGWYVGFFLVVCVLCVLRREHQPLKSRSLSMLLISVSSGLVLRSWSALWEVAIPYSEGWCAAYRWMVNFCYPGISLPYVLRALRLHLIFSSTGGAPQVDYVPEAGGPGSSSSQGPQGGTRKTSTAATLASSISARRAGYGSLGDQFGSEGSGNGGRFIPSSPSPASPPSFAGPHRAAADRGKPRRGMDSASHSFRSELSPPGSSLGSFASAGSIGSNRFYGGVGSFHHHQEFGGLPDDVLGGFGGAGDGSGRGSGFGGMGGVGGMGGMGGGGGHHVRSASFVSVAGFTGMGGEHPPAAPPPPPRPPTPVAINEDGGSSFASADGVIHSEDDGTAAPLLGWGRRGSHGSPAGSGSDLSPPGHADGPGDAYGGHMFGGVDEDLDFGDPHDPRDPHGEHRQADLADPLILTVGGGGGPQQGDDPRMPFAEAQPILGGGMAGPGVSSDDSEDDLHPAVFSPHRRIYPAAAQASELDPEFPGALPAAAAALVAPAESRSSPGPSSAVLSAGGHAGSLNLGGPVGGASAPSGAVGAAAAHPAARGSFSEAPGIATVAGQGGVVLRPMIRYDRGSIKAYPARHMMMWLALGLLPFLAFSIVEEIYDMELTPTLSQCIALGDHRMSSRFVAAIFHFVDALLLLLAVGLLWRVWTEFKIRGELITVFFVDLIIGIIHVVHLAKEDSLSPGYTRYLIAARVGIFFVVSLVQPLLASFEETNPMAEFNVHVIDMESLESLEGVLNGGVQSFDAFAQFMREAGGWDLLNFYIMVDTFRDLEDAVERERMAFSIYSSYLLPPAGDGDDLGDLGGDLALPGAAILTASGGPHGSVSSHSLGGDSLSGAGSADSILALIPTYVRDRIVRALQLAQHESVRYEALPQTLFDAAQGFVFAAMKQRWFPAFRHSQPFRDLQAKVYRSHQIKRALLQSKMVTY